MSPEDSPRRWAVRGARLRTLAQWVGAIVVLVLVARLLGGVRLPERFDPVWMAPAVAASVLAATLQTWAWRVYLRGLGTDVRWVHLFRADQAAQFASIFFPGGFLTRPVHLQGIARPAPVLGSTAVLRINTLALFSVALFLTAAYVGWARPGDASGLALLVGGVGLLVAYAAIRAAFLLVRPEEFPRSLLGRLAVKIGGLGAASLKLLHASLVHSHDLLRGGPAYRWGLAWSGLALLVVEGLASVAVARAVGVDAPFLLLLLIPTAAYSLSLLPFPPRGLGAVEAFGTAVLAGFGVATADGLAYFLLLRGYALAVTALMGGAAFLFSGWKVLGRSRAPASPRRKKPSPEPAGGEAP